MSEWWTYRPSDFLMFSPRTYARLFELFNAELWPLQIVLLAVAALVLEALRRRTRWALAAACGGIALAWLHVAWAFHLQRYAPVNWAAVAFGWAFAAQALLWGAAAWQARGERPRQRAAGMAWIALALVLHPLAELLLGRPPAQLQWFGLAPDPTVLASLGLLGLLPPRRNGALLWVLPLLWCGITGLTLWTLGDPLAPLMPLAALAALLLARARR